MTVPRRWTYMERSRLRTGRTLLGIAQIIGRDVATVSRYEAGLIRPRPDIFPLLAEALHCDLDELIATAPVQPRYTKPPAQVA